MKRLFYCFDCGFFETYLGYDCPKCGSANVEIDDEPNTEKPDDNLGPGPDQDAGEYFEYAT